MVVNFGKSQSKQIVYNFIHPAKAYYIVVNSGKDESIITTSFNSSHYQNIASIDYILDVISFKANP